MKHLIPLNPLFIFPLLLELRENSLKEFPGLGILLTSLGIILNSVHLLYPSLHQCIIFLSKIPGDIMFIYKEISFGICAAIFEHMSSVILQDQGNYLTQPSYCKIQIDYDYKYLQIFFKNLEGIPFSIFLLLMTLLEVNYQPRLKCCISGIKVKIKQSHKQL